MSWISVWMRPSIDGASAVGSPPILTLHAFMSSVPFAALPTTVTSGWLTSGWA
jgi:hypothetical protein